MKFSIITCTFNSEDYIQTNIDSVKSQVFKDFEHVFIDGFSTDKTIEIIKNYQKEFSDKVKIFQFAPKGISNAMNRGVENSNGDYLIHLHSDDSFYDEKVLSKISALIKNNNNPDWIYGKANFIDIATEKSRIIPHRKIYQKIRFWLLLITNYIPHQSVFVKKQVFNKFGLFEETYKNSMDYEMWLRLSKNKIKSLFVNEIICNFTVRKDSQSGLGKSNNEHYLAHKKHLKKTFLIKILEIINRINKKRNIL